jgi:hypothetical protein
MCTERIKSLNKSADGSVTDSNKLGTAWGRNRLRKEHI